MLNVACLQSVNELISEHLDPARLIEEINQTAGESDCAQFRQSANALVSDLRAGASPSAISGAAAMLPGNVAYLARMRDQRFRVRLVLLECSDVDLPLVQSAIMRYRALCRENDIELRVLSSRWRRMSAGLKVAGKLAFENEILDALENGRIDVLLLDRAMFYVGLLISPASPIAANVINSHPGLLSGPFLNAGKSPTIHALRLKREQGVFVSGISVHRVTTRVDVGELLCERRFSLLDVHTPQQLRSRVYCGNEALAQIAAVREGGFAPVNWSARQRIDVETADRLYRSIQPPPAPPDFGLRAS